VVPAMYGNDYIFGLPAYQQELMYGAARTGQMVILLNNFCNQMQYNLTKCSENQQQDINTIETNITNQISVINSTIENFYLGEYNSCLMMAKSVNFFPDYIGQDTTIYIHQLTSHHILWVRKNINADVDKLYELTQSYFYARKNQ